MSSVGVFLLIWPAWACEAHSVWSAAHRGVAPPGDGTFLHPGACALTLPYGAAVGAAPMLFVLLSVWLVVIAMVATPGRLAEPRAVEVER